MTTITLLTMNQRIKYAVLSHTFGADTPIISMPSLIALGENTNPMLLMIKILERLVLGIGA